MGTVPVRDSESTENIVQTRWVIRESRLPVRGAIRPGEGPELYGYPLGRRSVSELLRVLHGFTSEGAKGEENMKKLTVMAGLVACLAAGTAEASWFDRVGDKFVHGVGDVLYAPAELLVTTYAVADEFVSHNKLLVGVGLNLGSAYGAVMADLRLARGVSRILFCWIPGTADRRWSWFATGRRPTFLEPQPEGIDAYGDA